MSQDDLARRKSKVMERSLKRNPTVTADEDDKTYYKEMIDGLGEDNQNRASEKLQLFERRMADLQQHFSEYNDRLSSPSKDNKDLIAAHVRSINFYKENMSKAHKEGMELVKFSNDGIKAFNLRIIFYIGFCFLTFKMSRFCIEIVPLLLLLGAILVDLIWNGFKAFRNCQWASSELNRVNFSYGRLQTRGKHLVDMIRGKPLASLGSSSEPHNQGIIFNLEHCPEFQTLGSFEETVCQPLPCRMKPMWKNITNIIIPALTFLVLFVAITYLSCEKKGIDMLKLKKGYGST